MNSDFGVRSRGLQIYAAVVVMATVGLIWWGAAVTTEDVGLAVPDWPLSLGVINPEGWWGVPALFLEHGHRLMGMTVGILTSILAAAVWFRGNRRAFWEYVGVMTGVALILALMLFEQPGEETKKGVLAFLGSQIWLRWVIGVAAGLTFLYWLRHGRRVWEFVLVHIACGVMVDLARRSSLVWESDEKWSYWWPLIAIDLALLMWWSIGWMFRRWNLLTCLTWLALLAVTNQAIKGGLRVTEMSDTWGILHGCFAQAFFCLLVWIFLASSPRWEMRTDRVASSGILAITRLYASILGAAVFVQLILGASMRHLHRYGLPATDFPKTNGQWIPGFTNPDGTMNWDITVHFSHRAWAFVIYALSIAIMIHAFRHLRNNVLMRRLASVIFTLLCGQLILGMYVIWYEKPFWVTNIHVLTGLSILASSFVFLVRSWRTVGPTTLPNTSSVRHEEPSLAT